jgi:Membrane proteins related to metalloendopeptidases
MGMPWWLRLALIVAMSGALVVGTGATGAASPSSGTPVDHDTVPAWRWPVDPAWQVVRPFEAPATRYSAGHRGIDLAAARGSPVYAPADGVVRFAGRVVDRPVVTLEHADDLLSSMEPVAVELPVGTVVHAGEPIGAVASGGHCDGSCLHLGVRLHGNYVSPLLYLGGVPRAVLLPLR